jgi:ribonuclease Z
VARSQNTGARGPQKKDHALRVVFHLCGHDVFEHEQYKAFMKRFEDGVYHIVASRDHVPDPVTFTSAAFNQLRLNHLDSDIFPVPKYSLEAKKTLNSTDLPSNTDCMRAHTMIDVRPPRPPLRDSEAEANDLFHPAVLSGEPPSLSDAARIQFSEARARVDEASVPDVIGKDVTVVTLGTGSAIPSKYRNVSGTLLCTPGAGYILMDAGEGTWGQLSRNYGTAVWDVLRSLKCIFISHIHGDHHIGLAKILAMRQLLDPPPEEPLYLISNRMVFLYLRDYNALEELGFSEDAQARVVPILSDEIHWRNKGRGGRNYGDQDQKESKLAAEALCKTLGLQKIHTVDVEHRARCHGLIVKHLDGWSVVFSGDTVPTQKLVQAGAGATLLIHEATMANDQVEMARAKMHSTFGQAIDIGKSMNAQNILLTHFSARYPKMPPSVSERQAGDPVVAFAFDHANIKIGDMWKMGAYARAIEQSFIDITDIEGEEPEVIDAVHVDIS